MWQDVAAVLPLLGGLPQLGGVLAHLDFLRVAHSYSVAYHVMCVNFFFGLFYL